MELDRNRSIVAAGTRAANLAARRMRREASGRRGLGVGLVMGVLRFSEKTSGLEKGLLTDRLDGLWSRASTECSLDGAGGWSTKVLRSCAVHTISGIP